MLGDGAATLHHFACQKIGIHGTEYARYVHPEVMVILIVLGSEKSVYKIRREFFKLNILPVYVLKKGTKLRGPIPIKYGAFLTKYFIYLFFGHLRCWDDNNLII